MLAASNPALRAMQQPKRVQPTVVMAPASGSGPVSEAKPQQLHYDYGFEKPDPHRIQESPELLFARAAASLKDEEPVVEKEEEQDDDGDEEDEDELDDEQE